MIKDLIEEIAFPVFLTILIIFFGVCVTKSCINLADSVPVVITVENEKVFEGKSYLCSVESTGNTTKVTLYGGFLGFIPKAYYVSDNVKVAGKK